CRSTTMLRSGSENSLPLSGLQQGAESNPAGQDAVNHRPRFTIEDPVEYLVEQERGKDESYSNHRPDGQETQLIEGLPTPPPGLFGDRPKLTAEYVGSEEEVEIRACLVPVPDKRFESGLGK